MNENELEKEVYVETRGGFFLDCFSAISSGMGLIAIGFVFGFFFRPNDDRPTIKTESLVLQEWENGKESDEIVKPKLIQKTPKILDFEKEKKHEAGEIEYLNDKNAYVFYNEDGFTVCYSLDEKKGNGAQLKSFAQTKESGIEVKDE